MNWRDLPAVMRFGRHRGEEVHTLPTSYLRRVRPRVRSDFLRARIDRELRQREKRGKFGPPPEVAP